MNKSQAYALIKLQLAQRLEGERDVYANLANASAILKLHMEEVNWVGFYLLKNGELVLGPFQGLAAVTRIKVGSGVCGAGIKENRVQLVKDVHAFPGHIACDLRSRSEIVLPMNIPGRQLGVLDIDSPSLARFDEIDREELSEIVKLLEKSCDW